MWRLYGFSVLHGSSAPVSMQLSVSFVQQADTEDRNQRRIASSPETETIIKTIDNMTWFIAMGEELGGIVRARGRVCSIASGIGMLGRQAGRCVQLQECKQHSNVKR